MKKWLPVFLAFQWLYADEYIITSLNDSGAGTLREAMLAAVDDDVITFDSGITGIITLGSSLPPITAKNLLISGRYSMGITIDGASQYQIFNIMADEVHIMNLTLSNGSNASFGGAVYVGPSLNTRLDNLDIISCAGSNCQSPVYIDDGGFIHFVNLSFSSGSGPDIYFVNASAILHNLNHPPPVIHINGSGIAELKGPGRIDLVAFSDPIGILIYNHSAECIFTGTTSANLISVNSIAGNYTARYIASIGSTKPGNDTFGSIASSLDYIQTTDGTLFIKIDDSGSHDSLNVGHNLYPFGTLTILPESGNYTAGTSYTIITVAGKINNPFTTVTCPIANFPFTVVYRDNSIEIVITANFTI